MVINNAEMASAWQDKPTMQTDWNISNTAIDATKDPEVSLSTSTTPYEFVHVDCTINSVDVSALFKAITQGFDKEYAPTPSHDSRNPKGFTSVSLLSTIKVGIWREDVTTIHNLRISDTTFPVVVTYARIAGEHDCTFTYATCRSLKPTDKAEDNKVMTEADIEVEGTPTVVINDDTLNYD
jgi:hypothetical protein